MAFIQVAEAFINCCEFSLLSPRPGVNLAFLITKFQYFTNREKPIKYQLLCDYQVMPRTQKQICPDKACPIELKLGQNIPLLYLIEYQLFKLPVHIISLHFKTI